MTVSFSFARFETERKEKTCDTGYLLLMLRGQVMLDGQVRIACVIPSAGAPWADSEVEGSPKLYLSVR